MTLNALEHRYNSDHIIQIFFFSFFSCFFFFFFYNYVMIWSWYMYTEAHTYTDDDRKFSIICGVTLVNMKKIRAGVWRDSRWIWWIWFDESDIYFLGFVNWLINRVLFFSFFFFFFLQAIQRHFNRGIIHARDNNLIRKYIGSFLK